MSAQTNKQHTPGPWKVDGQKVIAPESPKRYWGELKEFSGPFIVVQCGVYVSADREEVKANARLIAAAPELLEALKAMVANYEPYPGHEIGDKARAAIAKAKGAA